MSASGLLVAAGTALLVAASSAGRGRTCGGSGERVPTGPRPCDEGADDRSAPAGHGEGVADVGVVLELLAVATGTTSLPDALRVVGEAVGGAAGRGLVTAGAALVLGAGWDEAWASAAAGSSHPGGRGSARSHAADAPLLGVVAGCLRPAWEQGAAPATALRAARDRHDREAEARAVEAAERLAVRVVVPLGLCLLPAFVLLGLVPAVVALGSGLL